jgi:hypothetical protein
MEEISGTSRGADAAAKSTKRTKKSSATPPAGDTAKNLVSQSAIVLLLLFVPGKLT